LSLFDALRGTVFSRRRSSQYYDIVPYSSYSYSYSEFEDEEEEDEQLDEWGYPKGFFDENYNAY